jgi:hypothetical protein
MFVVMELTWRLNGRRYLPARIGRFLCPLRGPLGASDSGRPVVGVGARRKRQKNERTEYDFFPLYSYDLYLQSDD